MAKQLLINFGSDTFSLSPVKIDRKKLYGWSEVKVVDSNGNPCKQVSLASNGTTIIPSGSIKLGMMSENGKWMEKTELVAVHSDGTKAEMIPSTFDTGITLEKKATAEEILNLIVSSVYVLDGEESTALAEKIGKDIYSFRFNYRADYNDASAFILSNGKSLFILTGTVAKFDFLSFNDQGTLDVDDDESEDLEDDELDFGMI